MINSVAKSSAGTKSVRIGEAVVDIKRLIRRASEVIVCAERSAAESPDSLPPRTVIAARLDRITVS